MSAKKAFVPIWLKALVVLAALGAAGFLFLRHYRPVAEVETVISGEAVDAKPGSVAVEAEYTMELKSQIGGRVLKEGYHLDPGMHVKEGEVLAHLDPGDILIDIDQVQNEYDSAKQRIAAGSAATYELQNAQAELVNADRLFKLGQVSDNDYQKARRAVETIKQQLALEKIRDEEDLKTDETTLRSKHRQVEKMTITAPFDGEISTVYAHPGDLIDSGSPIVSLITTNRVVKAMISEEDFANIKVGQKASLTFLPYGAWLYNGVVAKILPTADPQTQRHIVHVTVTDIDPQKLIPGITGEVSIVVGSHDAKAIVPRRAVQNDAVYVVRDGHVELRRIKKGFVWLTGVEVTEGLEPGEQVIVEDLDAFRDGDAVRVRELPSDVFAKHG